MVTRRGDNGPDTISFRPLGNSNDRGYGLGGDDRLFGGSGSDRLYGQNGSDLLNGDAGNDFLYGGSGNDRLDGGTGNDRLFGDAGFDRLLGGSGNDVLKGGGGTSGDFFDGGAGRDILDGSGDRNGVPGGPNPEDTYRIAFGQSAASNSTCDVIVDWFFYNDAFNNFTDQIDSNIAGTETNFVKTINNATTSMNAAKAFADGFAADTLTHVLIYNDNQKTGYLVSDLNNDEVYETGVIIRGLANLNEIYYFSII